jgi:hypothetical protein
MTDWLEQWQQQADEWQAEIEAQQRWEPAISGHPIERELATDDEEHQGNGDEERQTDELGDDIPY